MNENSTISNAYDGKHDEYGHDLPRWMNFEHVIDIGEADPTQTATDYYGFELPNGVAMVIQSQPSHRDHPFIVYSYGDGACPHDDVEFDSLRTAISYASQLHSGAIDPDYLRVEYTHDEYETLCWRDFYQAAHGNIEYASRLVDQCNGGFREGFGPYACAAEDLAEGEIVNFYNHESKEARTIPVNPFAASKANKAAREAFFERKDAEREQGKGLGAKAASARGASEKLDGQSQPAPAKDNLEH